MSFARLSLALPLALVALSLQAQPQRQFPCELVEFSQRGTNLEGTCRLPQTASFDYAVTIGELVSGNVTSTRNGHLSLDINQDRRHARVSVDAGEPLLQTGKSYRLTTLSQYPVNGQQIPFVVTTADFDFPPKVPFPCTFVDTRITGLTTMRVRCDERLGSPLDLIVTISDMIKGAAANPRPARLVLDPNVERQWAQLTIPTNQPFAADQKYRIESLATYPSDPAVPGSAPIAYSPAQLDFDTASNVSIAVPFGSPAVQPVHSADGRRRFLLTSKVAIDPLTLDSPGATPRRVGKIYEDLPLLRTELDALFHDVATQLPGSGSDQIGQIFVWIADPGPKSLNTHLTVTGLKNIFNKELTIPSNSRLTLPGAPKGKDDATVFGKFLNQAGPGSKPGWAADIKFAPALAYAGAGFFFNLQVLADVGIGTVKDNKTTNTIKTGIGVTRFVATGNKGLPGLQVTPNLAFETDRQGYHQNLLFDGDVQFFGKGWRNSIADRLERTVADSMRVQGKLPDPATLSRPKTGILLQAFLGTEVGGALSANDVKSSDQKTTVKLPTYSIARIRPKLAATFEVMRLSFSASATLRYLLAAENVTRETQVPDPANPSKEIAQVYLHTAKGFRPYGEAGVAYQLDNDGHVALSVTYKLGSVPPNFDYVSTVQTGFVFKY